MRIAAVFLLALLAVSSAQAAFGHGGPAFEQLDAPDSLPQSDNAGEPTIGIPWNTDSVFYQSAESTYRVTFDGTGTPAWEDVTPLITSVNNVDPMLHADPVTGRVWAGGLDGPCSVMAYSDDDGETWDPTGNMCTGAQFDHQSIGSGPWAEDGLLAELATYDHAVYYCAQLAGTACTTSLDGGVTWEPPNEVMGSCGGLHGHIRVSPVTGTAIVPHRNCGANLGFGVTTDNGVTWDSRVHPDAPDADNGFDPSAQFTQDSGWLYFGQADEFGVKVGLSKDEGQSWEEIGGGMGTASTWLDVGRFHDPPVLFGTFADVQAGDDDRAAFSFLGVEDSDGDGTADEYPEDPFHTCNPPQEGHSQMYWYYYVATTYDAGDTWTVTKVNEDPVQVGGIWGGQTDDTDPDTHCRNILDFNDMDIDSKGRIHIALADGCIDACAEDPANAPGESNLPGDDADGFRTDHAAIIRQTDGPGLFAAYDTQAPPPEDDDIDDDGIPNDEDDDIDGDGVANEDDPDPTFAEDRDTPAGGALFALSALAVAAVLRRR